MYVSPVTVNDGIVYAFGQSKIVAVDAKTGALRWSYTTNGWAATTAIDGNTLVALSWSTSPIGLELSTGKRRWQRSDLSVNFSDVIAFGGLAYFAGKDGIFALDVLTGATIWSSQLPDNQKPKSDDVFDYDLALADGKLYVSGGIRAVDAAHKLQKYLMVFDALTGSMLWHTPASASWSEVAVANGVVYAFHADKVSDPWELVALSASANVNNKLWSYLPADTNGYMSLLAIANNRMYIAYVNRSGESIVATLQ